MKKIFFLLTLCVCLSACLSVSAQTALTRQASFGETPAAVTFTAVDGSLGNKILNTDGKTILQFKNGSGGSITVTIAVQNASFTNTTYGKVTKANIVLTILAGATHQVGPLPTAVYNDSSGYLQITYSSGTSVTAAAFSAP